MQANKRTDERVAQYLHLDSWLFWTTVPPCFCRLLKTRAGIPVITFKRQVSHQLIGPPIPPIRPSLLSVRPSLLPVPARSCMSDYRDMQREWRGGGLYEER